MSRTCHPESILFTKDLVGSEKQIGIRMTLTMKAGRVAIIGRPNSGKSTLLNNLLGHKVSITSPKPQTTRFPVEAVLQDERGQIVFVDTPGIFGRVKDPVSAKINQIPEMVLKDGVNVVVYLVDHSRDRDVEENKIFGITRGITVPKILAINKIDVKEPSFMTHYTFMEEEFDMVVKVSALYRRNTNLLVDAIFELLPEGEKLVEHDFAPTPAINMDSKMFISEIIREKAFLFLRKEVPYTMMAVVDEIKKREDGTMYIQARIITHDSRYKPMIIGEKGRMIKEIGQAARKELQTATNQKIFLNLTVEVNPHWYDTLI